MSQILVLLYSQSLQILVKLFVKLTGRGGGKFVRFLPKSQQHLVKNYAGNFQLQVDTTYPIEASVWLASTYDPTTTRFLQQVLRADDVFLDIGANCGAITLVAASIIQTGKIYAFEPGPIIRSRLQSNLDLNSSLKDIVQVVPLGLGQQRCQLSYFEDQTYRGNGGLFQNDQGITVEVLPLDEWVTQEKLKKIDVIKLDVEGMEYEVLSGSKTVLTTYHPTIYFETLPGFFVNKPYSIHTIYEFLTSLGYVIVGPRKPYASISLDGPYPANSVAIHPTQMHRLERSN
ncbi:FkbM family methyltransferase [Trichocoleus sp. FACHB-262]|uniref:FkbM family methyltransferase n=1 Tax=Trichocoleus sp. FACHB-262 TaxID=2692869 RepID=UPI00168540C1|nr:FkbM family methyltransferase [Trichocoleus sp. FACHB-262]MBD2122987.1 FkbM family methyltransferase [Trichocoleus sp. FACHB-262]